MNLTNEQKNKIYKRALLEIQNKKNHYCCPAIKFGYFNVTGEKYPNNESPAYGSAQFNELSNRLTDLAYKHNEQL